MKALGTLLPFFRRKFLKKMIFITKCSLPKLIIKEENYVLNLFKTVASYLGTLDLSIFIYLIIIIRIHYKMLTPKA